MTYYRGKRERTFSYKKDAERRYYLVATGFNLLTNTQELTIER